MVLYRVVKHIILFPSSISSITLELIKDRRDMAAVAGWDFGPLAVLARNDNPVSTKASNACLYAGSDADGDGWRWEDSMSFSFGADTITTFGVDEHPTCESAASAFRNIRLGNYDSSAFLHPGCDNSQC